MKNSKKRMSYTKAGDIFRAINTCEKNDVTVGEISDVIQKGETFSDFLGYNKGLFQFYEEQI